MRHALIIVDIQNDFLPGGALAVPDGDAIIPVVNGIMGDYDVVVATQDWHPANHGSFASQHDKKPGELISLNGLTQVLWPDHCVQGTRGADFAQELNTGAIDRVFRKGMDPSVDSYSGFFDNDHRHETGLGGYLKECGVTHISIVGLATDYCVKFTALDGVALGYSTSLLLDGCRGVELAPGDCDRAIEEMKQAGITIN